MQKVYPTLRITDYEKSKAFYVDGLGFQIESEHRFAPHLPVFMTIKCKSATRTPRRLPDKTNWPLLMSIYNHNIYDNVRTRVIVLHQGCMLLHPPQETGSGWRPPGGGLEPQESLAECAIREVFEETGIHIHVSGVAFLREWVVPRLQGR